MGNTYSKGEHKVEAKILKEHRKGQQKKRRLKTDASLVQPHGTLGKGAGQLRADIEGSRSVDVGKRSSVDDSEHSQAGNLGAAKTTGNARHFENDEVAANVKRRSLFLAAIDFGTTFSGFAYSMINDYDMDPLKIMSKDNWSAPEAQSTAKTPSAILFKPDKSFYSFGYTAETNYSELFWEENPNDDQNPQNWYFFRNYKMFLYKDQMLNRDDVLKEEGGKTLPAIYVFSQSIKFLRDCLWETLKKRFSEIEDNDIFWVLTVPAIWSDKAKQFMREAAVKAGIRGENLTLALEPEAAAVYCRHLLLEKVTNNDGATQMTSLPPGTCFMVIDMGGGTIDSTVYEVEEGDVLTEIYPANGGDWGGNVTNITFLKLLEMVVGNNVYNDFKEHHRGEFLQLEQRFECKKRGNYGNTINLLLSVELIEIFEANNQTTLTDHIKNKFPDGTIVLKKDKICLTSDTFEKLFEPAITGISGHMSNIMKFLPGTHRPKTLILVGGFADCQLMRDKITCNFPDMQVIVPDEAVTAVMKGAVLFGRDPSVISGRVVKRTYGIEYWPPFIEGKHPDEKKICINGKWKCKDVFRKHVKAGSIAKVGVPSSKIKYSAIDEKQNEMCLPIFVSTDKSPQYITDDSCTYLGTLNIDMKDTRGGDLRSVQVSMIFEGTEFEVEARDETSGEVAVTKVDFLG